MKLHIAGIIVFVLAAGLVARPAAADIITLADGNSVLRFDTAAERLHYDWEIGGRDYLQQQGFWYRIEGQPGGETPLYQLATPTVFKMDSNTPKDGLDDYLRLTYAGTGLTIEVAYTLMDGGTRSDLSEGIRVTNTGSSPIVVHFFQYTDFDLAPPGGDTIEIRGGNTATQTVAADLLSETGDSPAPDHFMAGLDGAILALLRDSLPTTLDGTTGPLTGNAEWAFQWDLTLQPGAAIPIGKDKTLIVPEPATLALLIGGLAVFLGLRRKQ